MNDKYYPYYEKEHHNLDVYPIPRERQPRYINEPSLIDPTLDEYEIGKQFSDEPDNKRIYVPLDINEKSVLRRIDAVIGFFGDATFANEMSYMNCIGHIISQVEIYDQLWFVREMSSSPDGKHSKKGIELITKIVKRLEDIEALDSEIFPMCYASDLKKAFGVE